VKIEENSHEAEVDLYSVSPFLPKQVYSMNG